MYKLRLYIEGQEVEMFNDENVVINSSVQDIKDISKVYTDYSKPFTIPCSPNNNGIFKHWYNADITGGFSANKRVNATLELNYIPFKKGTLQLDNVQLKNGNPYAYKVTFYGNLVSLTDLFGDDLLNDLDLSAYNHEFNSTNVLSGLGSSLFSGSVIYPLISSERNWLWDSGTVDDIFYKSATLPSTTNGIQWNELKPAIKLQHIVDAIETKYGVTFSADFFDATDFSKLFIWCSKDKGNMIAPGEPILLDFDTGAPVESSFVMYCDSDGDSIEGMNKERYTIAVTPTVGYEDVNYTIIIDDGVSPLEYDKQGTGNAFYEIECVDYLDPQGATISFSIQSEESFSFSATLYYNAYAYIDVSGIPYTLDTSGTGFIGTGTGTITTTGYVYITDTLDGGVLQPGQMPEMTVSSFLSSLFKMFNLVIVPTNTNTFDVMPLDSWYAEGNVLNITKYINRDTIDIKRPKLNRRITFNYQESETLLNEQYRVLNSGDNYGDLESDFDYDGGELKIEVGFENVMFERMPSQTDGVISDTHVGRIIDVDLEPVESNPIIFYNRGATTLTTLTNGIAFINDTGTRSEILSYNNVGQENFLTNGTITNSLSFGAEISTWTLSTQTESLYSNYWQDYITDLYDASRRVYNYNAILPLGIITQLKLNDIVIVERRSYIINNMDINLTNGQVKFELLNYIGDPVNYTFPLITLDNGYVTYDEYVDDGYLYNYWMY